MAPRGEGPRRAPRTPPGRRPARCRRGTSSGEGTNYQWRLGEGQRAINQGYAGLGALDSGAARTAQMEHGQNFASNELANWMSQLFQQQQVGANAAGNLAGVGNTDDQLDDAEQPSRG